MVNPLATAEPVYVCNIATFLTLFITPKFFGYSKSKRNNKSTDDAEICEPSIASGNRVWLSIRDSDNGVLHKRNSSNEPVNPSPTYKIEPDFQVVEPIGNDNVAIASFRILP